MPIPGQILISTDPRTVCTDKGTHYPYPAVDAFAPRGRPLWAPYNGTCEPGTYSKGGNACWFYPDLGQAPYKVLYLAHGNVRFHNGRASQGQQIGQVGDSGNAAGNPHCHFAGGDSTEQISGRNGSGSYWFEPWVWGEGSTPGPQPPPTSPNPRFSVEAKGGLNLRTAPGIDTKVIRTLSEGEVVTATIKDSQQWRKVKDDLGNIGWVASDYLKRV